MVTGQQSLKSLGEGELSTHEDALHAVDGRELARLIMGRG
jgi:hypothetical protein